MSFSLSVAMCTLDGAAFLPEQLGSLLKQTRLPDELVVCDDGSQDGTIDILQDFARLSPFTVRLVRNSNRLGVAKNFEQAISLCQGELIALADQDDVWHATKLERLVHALGKMNIGLAFSDAELVNDMLQPLGYRMWQRVNFHEGEQKQMASGDPLSVLLKHFVVTGATLAFRTELRKVILPLPPEWPHDAWIASVIAAVADISPLGDALIKYRQHSGNAVGGKRIGLVDQMHDGLALGREVYYQTEIKRFRLLLQRLLDSGMWKAATAVEAKLAHLRMRADLPPNRLRRVPNIALELARGGYRKYARDWKSITMDLFFP